MAKGIMVIDGQRVPFDGERNVLAVIRKAGIDTPHSATIPSFPFTARAACVSWRT